MSSTSELGSKEGRRISGNERSSDTPADVVKDTSADIDCVIFDFGLSLSKTAFAVKS